MFSISTDTLFAPSSKIRRLFLDFFLGGEGHKLLRFVVDQCVFQMLWIFSLTKFKVSISF